MPRNPQSQYKPGKHPNSQAAIRPHRWKPGQSGNPNGMPNAGASIRLWINILADKPRGEIEKVAQDPEAPANKRIAAMTVLGALDDRWTDFGKRFAADDIDRIWDRTEGKPTQRVETEHSGEVTVQRVIFEERPEVQEPEAG